jgi:hypothetical protein
MDIEKLASLIEDTEREAGRLANILYSAEPMTQKEVANLVYDALGLKAEIVKVLGEAEEAIGAATNERLEGRLEEMCGYLEDAISQADLCADVARRLKAWSSVRAGELGTLFDSLATILTQAMEA